MFPSYYERVEFGKLCIWFDGECQPGISREDDVAIFIYGAAIAVAPPSVDREPTADVQQVAELLRSALAVGERAFLEELDYIAGRHVIIAEVDGSRAVFHDAHGTRSVFHHADGAAVASHADLLARFTSEIAANEAELKKSESWAALPLSFAWDETRYPNIRALLPNHCLDMDTNRVSRYFPREENRYSRWNAEEKVAEIHRLWSNQMSALAEKHERFIVSLSGGLDSRVVLSALRDFRSKVDAFTYFAYSGKSKWVETLQLDRDIANEVLELTRVNHVQLVHGTGGAFSKDELDILDRNSLGQHGRWLVKHYLHEFGDVSGIHLRGNTHETIRVYFGGLKGRDPLGLVRNLMSHQFKRAELSEELKLSFATKLEATLDHFGYKDSLFDFDAADVFYWENRMGRWIAEVFNETDVAFDTISPANMRAIVEIGLSYSLEDRRSGIVFTELINRNWSELNFPGVNTRENLYENNLKQARKNRELTARAALAPAWIGTAVEDTESALGTAPLTLESSGTELAAKHGEFQIPAADIVLGAFASRSIVWPEGVGEEGRPRGVFAFQLKNQFANPRGTNYLRFEVLVNGDVLAAHRFGLDSSDTYWAVYGLKPGDKITLGVRALRNAQGESWSRASRTIVTALVPPHSYWARKDQLGLGFATTSVAARSS